MVLCAPAKKASTMKSRITTFAKEYSLFIALSLATIVLCIACAKWLVWPGYTSPKSRMFTSKLGYAAQLRKKNKPFPVVMAKVQHRKVTSHFLGEGIMRSEPVQVPVIAMSRILSVHAKQGDRVKKGQLLAILDPSRLKIKIEAAKAQLQTANAEFERTKIGSAYILEKERPERDQIRVNAAENEVGIRKKLDELYGELSNEGLLSEEETLLKRLENADALTKLQEAQLALNVAQGGRVRSLEIAQAAIRDAELALAYRQDELRDYKVYAPTDGVIERCLIHEGEYNQDPGKPAFLIASGLWFEAYLDQTAIGRIGKDATAEVHLEAFPGESFEGKITQVLPLVSYSLGGPETNRPIRPLGTGAPEWPATFPVKVAIDIGDLPVVPGLTGFAKFVSSSKSVAAPQGSIARVSGSKGIVLVADGDEFYPTAVTIGATSDGWTAIKSGLDPDTIVIADGHQVLEPGDRIAASNAIKSARSASDREPSDFDSLTTVATSP